MAEVLVTLDRLGYVSEVAYKADMLMAFFLSSEASQSILHRDRISSAPNIIKRCAGDARELETQFTTALKQLYGAYYDAVDLTVTVTGNAEAYSGSEVILNIKIAMTLKQAGTTHSLGRLLAIVNNKIAEQTTFTVR